MRSDHKYIMLGTPCNCKYLVLPRIGQGWEGPRFAIQSNVFKIQTAVTFYRVRVIVTDADHNCQKGSNATKTGFQFSFPAASVTAQPISVTLTPRFPIMLTSATSETHHSDDAPHILFDHSDSQQSQRHSLIRTLTIIDK